MFSEVKLPCDYFSCLGFLLFFFVMRGVKKKVTSSHWWSLKLDNSKGVKFPFMPCQSMEGTTTWCFLTTWLFLKKVEITFKASSTFQHKLVHNMCKQVFQHIPFFSLEALGIATTIKKSEKKRERTWNKLPSLKRQGSFSAFGRQIWTWPWADPRGVLGRFFSSRVSWKIKTF